MEQERTTNGSEEGRPREGVGVNLVILESSVYGVYFMVKLLRACVRMPWRDQATKDVASDDMLRGGASNL
jgi:hypothetical protein